MSLSFYLEIVTPQKVAFNKEIEFLNAPTAQGEITVLPKHAPLFTKLVEGEIKIKIKGDTQMIYLAVGGGFLEVSQNSAKILVTQAVHADEINEKEMIEAKKKAEEALKAKPEGEELIEAQSLFKRSVIALNVYKRRRRKSLDEIAG